MDIPLGGYGTGLGDHDFERLRQHLPRDSYCKNGDGSDAGNERRSTKQSWRGYSARVIPVIRMVGSAPLFHEDRGAHSIKRLFCWRVDAVRTAECLRDGKIPFLLVLAARLLR